jgi:hypothetical protein
MVEEMGGEAFKPRWQDALLFQGQFIRESVCEGRGGHIFLLITYFEITELFSYNRFFTNIEFR